jgi:hypothetical protein
MEHPNSLQIPQGAFQSTDAKEVLRARIVDEGLHVSLNPTVFEHAEVFGVLLSDVAHHIAKAREAEGLDEANDTIDAIRRVFVRETWQPSDQGTIEKMPPTQSN